MTSTMTLSCAAVVPLSRTTVEGIFMVNEVIVMSVCLSWGKLGSTDGYTLARKLISLPLWFGKITVLDFPLFVVKIKRYEYGEHTCTMKSSRRAVRDRELFRDAPKLILSTSLSNRIKSPAEYRHCCGLPDLVKTVTKAIS